MALDRRIDLVAVAADLIDRAKRAGADQADVVAAFGESLSVSARAGALEDVERAEGLDIGLRVLIDAPGGRRQATASASDASSDALDSLAERATAMAREAPADADIGLASPDLFAPDSGDDLELIDPSEPPGPETLLETALALEAAALDVSGVSKTEGAGTGWRRSESAFVTSEGFSRSVIGGSRSIGVAAIAGEGLGMERDFSSSAARFAADLRAVDAVGREAGERAIARLDPGPGPVGALPVLFDRRAAPGLIGGLLGALNGDSVARGSSFLAKRMGERILPAGVALTDDPTIRRGLGSRLFDGEGLAGRRKTLIDDGVVSDWLLDLAAARKLGRAPNGSASRGAGSPPRPGPSNVRLTAGASSRADLIGAVERGLLVVQTMGGGLNSVTGEYSSGASGFWIENGAIARPASEVTIAGSALEMLASIALADDLILERRVEAPTLRVEGMTIAAG